MVKMNSGAATPPPRLCPGKPSDWERVYDGGTNGGVRGAQNVSYGALG